MDSLKHINSDNPNSLSLRVFKEIEDMILNGEIQPGRT